MGETIWTTHAIPVTDIFSYTTNHQAAIPHEWLAQVAMYLAYRWGGYSGLMVWFCLLTAGLSMAGYALCSLYSGNAKVGFLEMCIRDSLDKAWVGPGFEAHAELLVHLYQ